MSLDVSYHSNRDRARHSRSGGTLLPRPRVGAVVVVVVVLVALVVLVLLFMEKNVSVSRGHY